MAMSNRGFYAHVNIFFLHCVITTNQQQGALWHLKRLLCRARSSASSVPPSAAAATFREEMAARGGFQATPTGGGGGTMGPGPPVPGAGPGMGPGTPSGRMGPSSATQNHMYRSPMPGPGYPVSYRSIFCCWLVSLSARTKPPTAALSQAANVILCLSVRTKSNTNSRAAQKRGDPFQTFFFTALYSGLRV